MFSSNSAVPQPDCADGWIGTPGSHGFCEMVTFSAERLVGKFQNFQMYKRSELFAELLAQSGPHTRIVEAEVRERRQAAQVQVSNTR